MNIANPKSIALALIEAYNDCFVKRDIQELRNLYVPSGPFTYFDNHAGCDSTDIEDHLAKVQCFFESNADIPGLDTELIAAHIFNGTACITAHVRYRRQGEADTVRMSLFAELHGEQWRIRHLHYSALPV
jgi:hypothetical protein